MPKYLKNPNDGRIYLMTPALASRADLVAYTGPDPFKDRAAASKAQRVDAVINAADKAASANVMQSAQAEADKLMSSAEAAKAAIIAEAEEEAAKIKQDALDAKAAPLSETPPEPASGAKKSKKAETKKAADNAG